MFGYHTSMHVSTKSQTDKMKQKPQQRKRSGILPIIIGQGFTRFNISCSKNTYTSFPVNIPKEKSPCVNYLPITLVKSFEKYVVAEKIWFCNS